MRRSRLRHDDRILGSSRSESSQGYELASILDPYVWAVYPPAYNCQLQFVTKQTNACAAAGRGYDLLVYLPTVDRDGFDVILDDRDRLVQIQLNSIKRGGKAAG